MVQLKKKPCETTTTYATSKIKRKENEITFEGGNKRFFEKSMKFSSRLNFLVDFFLALFAK